MRVFSSHFLNDNLRVKQATQSAYLSQPTRCQFV